jgi:hypothetical protein
MRAGGIAAGALVWVLGALPGVAAAPSDGGFAEAGRVASAFYATYVKTRPGGVPNATARARFAPLLTRRLTALLTAADAAETHYAKATRGRVPPLVEGDLFTSLFEGADSFALGACSVEGAATACAVSLSYGSAGQPDTRWTDRVLLRREQGGWKIDDIAYGGTWDFANKGMMTDALNEAIDESRKPVP